MDMTQSSVRMYHSDCAGLVTHNIKAVISCPPPPHTHARRNTCPPLLLQHVLASKQMLSGSPCRFTLGCRVWKARIVQVCVCSSSSSSNRGQSHTAGWWRARVWLSCRTLLRVSIQRMLSCSLLISLGKVLLPRSHSAMLSSYLQAQPQPHTHTHCCQPHNLQNSGCCYGKT